MKRVIFSLLLLFLLSTPVRGAEVSGAVALTFDGYTPQVADTLDEFGAKGTFFLTEDSSEAVQRLIDCRHEIGLSLAPEKDVTGLSRRQIYEKLHTLQARLPEKYSPVWVRPPENWGDGFRQVTQATQLSLLRWSLDARKGLTDTMVDQIRSGDVIALGNISEQELSDLISILRSRDLKLVTVTELAHELDVDILPGQVYEKFPVQRTGNLSVTRNYVIPSQCAHSDALRAALRAVALCTRPAGRVAWESRRFSNIFVTKLDIHPLFTGSPHRHGLWAVRTADWFAMTCVLRWFLIS